ncbi:UDP-galactopyranose mutase [Mucilaginibacter yixingensis]|uniref:UDP-galactopyranose mutase n=1 Tax=Mucilaginibacter yixingensis TaxID=1295612 RepID=A0A2T5JGL1_9SPHI|nr:UDP-galactopyranose mutase [Mucilaginibacter yixingensis]PTR01582.1 UDP-galactopyranose mutase [Mucilaginibacter yixingensis]
MFDYLIVGAGFSGAVLAERIANELNKKVIIVDKRNHIGGNAYDYYNEYGILVHKYGPHWFHTNEKKVFDYLSQFTEWRYHYHIVKTYVDGSLLPIPINMDTINELYGMNLTSPKEVQAYFDSVKLDIKVPQNSEESVLSQVGEDLYNKFFKNYTLKQWEIHPKDLAASVTARIPTRVNRDNRYFTDKYQCMPKHGYTAMFNNILNNPNISILLNTDYKNIINEIPYKTMIYTGAIDSFFDYKFGKLPYRTLRFEHETLEKTFVQPVQQINYPNDYDFTRIVEWKHATGQQSNMTTITREFSELATDSSEKYYPIPREDNQRLFEKYRDEADKLESVIFCGRLADYKYYNMDQVVARALMIFDKKIKA